MASEIANLPGDPATLQHMLVDLPKTLKDRDLIIEKLTHELRVLKR
jgi:hypothetical protein